MNLAISNAQHGIIRRSIILLLAIAGFGVGYVFACLATQDVGAVTNQESAKRREKTDATRDRKAGVTHPSADLSPREVVEIQMSAMSEYQHDRTSIQQVFEFASPSNQAVTGPIERFENMVLTDGYRDLLFAKHFEIGDAVVKDGYATVLVSVVNEQERMSLYRFYLSQQTEVYTDCWMTDGVFLLVGGWQPGTDLPQPLQLPPSI